MNLTDWRSNHTEGNIVSGVFTVGQQQAELQHFKAANEVIKIAYSVIPWLSYQPKKQQSANKKLEGNGGLQGQLEQKKILDCKEESLKTRSRQSISYGSES